MKSRVSTCVASPSKPRRSFIVGAAATSGALAMPAIATAQTTTTLRWQSTFPSKDIQHEFATDYAKKVNELSGGRLKIEVLTAGAVVRPFDLLDAVAKGVLDGGFGILAYWYGKNSAMALWGTGPAFGMDGSLMLAWHNYGGGKELLAEIYKSLNIDVVSFMTGPMPNQPLGWFKKPIAKVEDLKGLKYRTVGLAIDLFSELGVSVNALPGPDIVPALDRGVLDAAEFNNASSDRALGFPDVSKVYMLQSFHQAAVQFEILFNGAKYRALPDELKAVLKYATEASAADISWKMAEVYSTAHQDLVTKDKVKVFLTPTQVLQAQLQAWEKVAERKSAENPMFKKVYESQREFAKRVVQWDLDTNPNRRLAFNFLFRKR